MELINLWIEGQYYVQQVNTLPTGTGIVVWWVNPQPVMLISHMDTSLSPGYSTSNPGSCWCTWEDRRKWLKCLGLAIHVGILDGVKGSQLWLGPEVMVIYSVNQSSHMGLPVWVMTVSLLILLPTNVPVNALKDDPSTWAHSTHVGDFLSVGFNLTHPWPLWPFRNWTERSLFF